jgi:heme/copper-type cytochrome/quinol oxidase subunit 3
MKNLSVNNSDLKHPVKFEFHPYHIVDVSPWPIVTALSAFFTVFGLALYMHSFYLGAQLLFFGFFAIIINAFCWWRDIIREGTFEGVHTFAVQYGLRFGMILFIVSEIMLFFAFFWAFFHSSLNPVPEIGCIWPPKGIHVIRPWITWTDSGIPLYNTIILLISGAFLTWSHAALLEGDREDTFAGLTWTIMLATLFTLIQGYEYCNALFNINDGIYGSTFYMLTGLHGAHVIIGTCFLIVALVRLYKGQLRKENHIGFETAAWYWHFVDVVWIFLFVTVYIWGSN